MFLLRSTLRKASNAQADEAHFEWHTSDSKALIVAIASTKSLYLKAKAGVIINVPSPPAETQFKAACRARSAFSTAAANFDIRDLVR